LKGHGYEIGTGDFSEYEFASSKNSNSNRPARGGCIIRDWKANQKTAIKEKSLAKAKSLPVLGIEFCHTTGWYYNT